MKTRSLFTILTLLLTLILSLAAAPVNARPMPANSPKAETPAPVVEEQLFTVEELKAMAENCRESGNTAGLASALRGWAAQEPSRFDVRLELGAVYISQNKLPEAIQVLGEASSIIPSDEAPHRLLAQIYKRQGNDSLRCFHLINAARLAQRNWENQFNLAVYYISKGKSGHAEKLLVKTMELNSAYAPAKFEYAKLMIEKGDAEAAFRKFDEAFLLETENVRYQAYYAYAAALSGRNSIARESIAAALGSAPKNTTVLYMAGLIHLNSGNNAAAERSLREALRYSPTDMPVIEALGDALAADFKYKEACGNYLTVWQTAGYSDRIAYKLGKTLAYDKKFKEAKDFLETVVAKNPNNGEAFYRLTEVYCELGNMKQANATLARFGSEKHIVWRKAAEGKVYEASSEPDLALTAYTAAYMVSQHNAQANAGLGRLMLKLADFDQAVEYLDAAIALEPANMDNYLDKAKAYGEKGSHNEAVAVYESILARDSRHPEVYLAIAAVKEEQGNPRDAIKCLTQGLEANPKETNMLLSLGKLYQATKQYEQAVSAYQASLGKKATINNIETLRVIGNIYHSNLTNEKKAKEFFKKYVRAGGKDVGVEQILARK